MPARIRGLIKQAVCLHERVIEGKTLGDEETKDI